MMERLLRAGCAPVMGGWWRGVDTAKLTLQGSTLSYPIENGKLCLQFSQMYTFLRVWKGTDVLIHVALPARMPTDNLTVGVPRCGMVAESHADTHAPCA